MVARLQASEVDTFIACTCRELECHQPHARTHTHTHTYMLDLQGDEISSDVNNGSVLDSEMGEDGMIDIIR